MFKYYNRNPNNLVLKDCVCKAISTATNLKYEAVNNLLKITAKENKCDKLCVCCYDHLLSDTLCYRRINVNFEQTAVEVSNSYPKNILIIRIDGHLTCSMFGTISDIWDCSEDLVDCFWIID